MADDIEAFMSEASGKKVPGFTFTNVGDSLVGTVTRRSIADVPVIGSKTGEREKKLIIELKTDKEYSQPKKDPETRQTVMVTGDEWSLWIRKSQLLTALSNALKAADAPKGAPLPGDRIKVVLKDTEPSKTPGFNDKKIYEVTYKAGAPEVPPVDVDELL